MQRKTQRARHLVGSTLALRAIATAITLSSFGGMTIFASQNLYASNAPLQPAAVAVVATATPAPTTAPSIVTTSRTTVRSSVPSTTTAAITRTKQS
jgi:hypothetical protein